jgi:phospholipid/cholesterol/gamma-HCH transport system substrate-binding protein
MAKSTVNNIKLGIFVMAGLLFLILLLYMIGKNKNLFGANFLLKARFDNTQGLVPGNNVRFAGIEIGTVRSINIINDTLIEVNMVIKKDMQQFIRKNAVVSIGTDGLMGNKLLNILPVKNTASGMVHEGDVLSTRKVVDTDAMLVTLQETNQDIAVLAANLKNTIQRVNNSTALWSIINDSTLPIHLRMSMINLQRITATANQTMTDFQQIVSDVKGGEGSVGAILKDTGFITNLNTALLKIQNVGNNADTLAQQINTVVKNLHNEIESGNGIAHTLLKDSTLVDKLNNSLRNIEEGTEGFNENMEALKHNFLFRGYFRRMEKQQKQQDTQGKVSLK